MDKITLALESLHTRHSNLFKGENEYNAPIAHFSPPWPSDSIIKQCDNYCYWKATPKDNLDIFQDIEKALELEFHPDIKSFYGSFWANGLCVEREDINFNLIQTWNTEDEEQLKENILGHCYAKLKARLPLTLFIGSTHGNDVISLDNKTGSIVLEKPGRKAHKELSETLESFLLSLNPTSDSY